MRTAGKTLARRRPVYGVDTDAVPKGQQEFAERRMPRGRDAKSQHGEGPTRARLETCDSAAAFG